MRKAEVQMSLKKGADDGAYGRQPPSPRLASKRPKVNPDQVVPGDPEGSPYPTQTPPVFIRKMRNSAVGTGCDIRLKVAVAGDPQPTLYWYHNDDLVNMDNQEYGGLWIRDCKQSDAGLYTCIATNDLGETRSSAVLAVLDLGEDSENTEDEGGDPQVPMEHKEGPEDLQEQAAQRVPTGDRVMDAGPEGAGGHLGSTDRWEGAERSSSRQAARANHPRGEQPPPGGCPQIRHLGVEPLVRASRANLTRPVWGSEESVSLASDYYGSTFSLYRGRTFSIPLSHLEDVLRDSPPQVLPPPSPLPRHATASPLLTRPGSAPVTPLAPRKKAVVPSDYQDTVPGEFEEKIKQPKPMSQSSTQDSRPQTPVLSEGYSRKDLTPRPSPKLTRPSSKIFEKVRDFAERRRSTDNEGSISGRSWAGFHRAPSVDSDDGGSRLGISRESSKEDLSEALKADAAQRRSVFRQRAASLEDRPRYTQKVQDIESKFTEELQRIKKLVGKPHMKKSFSTEQLSSSSSSRRSRPQPLRKLEPIPPQVLQKLQDRERAQQAQEQHERDHQSTDQSPRKSPSHVEQSQSHQQAQQQQHANQQVPIPDRVSAAAQPPHQPQQPEPPKRSTVSIMAGSRLGHEVSPPEAMSPSELPGQRSEPRLMRTYSPSLPRRSPIDVISHHASEDRPRSPHRRMESPVEMVRKLEPRPPSPLVQRVVRGQEVPGASEREGSGRKTPVEVNVRKLDRRPESPLVQRRDPPAIQERPGQAPSKPPRVSVPVLEEEMEVDVTPVAPVRISGPASGGGGVGGGGGGGAVAAAPAPRLPIPTIIVEEEPMEVAPAAVEKTRKSSPVKEEKAAKSRGKGRRTRPMSPELESSDDSYVSAGEDPMEAPMFEFPLHDVVASSGVEVVLKCIIAGTPLPEVTWKRNNTEVRNSPTHTVKVEGERHSLIIKKTKPTDAGTYTVTATNQMGSKSCNASLVIKAEPSPEHRGNLGVPMDIASPITSDEEYLSPMEESMDYGSPYRGTDNKTIMDPRFREPPAFQATMNDQSVIEGQEVTMSVRMTGQPKPMLYWLRDRVTIKTGQRHIVRETEEGFFEMVIKSAVKSDSGVYTCKIINEYGTKQCEAKLDVNPPPIEPQLAVIRPVKDVTVNAGETALFECHVTGPQDVDVDWLSDGKLIQPALLNCKMHFDGRRCRLLLNSVHEDDSGTYTCKLSTAKEELTSSARLKVIPSIEPLFTRKPDVLEVIEGRNARFDCKVSGTPPPTVVWSHFDHPLEENEDIRILKEGGRHSLVISHVCTEEEGLYTVVARNPHGVIECSAELYVQEPRPAISSQMAKLEKMPSIPEEPEVPENEVERFTMPDFVKPLYDLDVIEGKEAVLKCKVAGLPYPTICWFHNGIKIASTEDRKMTQYRDIHSLVIRSVCHAHGGVYKSVISNKVGKATCYAHLYVTDIIPDPPDGAPMVESITGKTITLKWKKPKRLDPSIDPSTLMYAVQQQALGSIQWTIVASCLKETSYTVTQLTKGVRYAFRVLSITSKCFSKPSAATDPVLLVDRGPYLQEIPVMTDKPDVVYAVENQPVSISITLNHVNATVAWKRRGTTLVNRPGMFEMTMPDDNQHTLKLVRVKATDAGQFTCVASNPYGSDQCTFSLELAAPPTFESIMEDLDVNVGETPRFAVVVEGKPIPDILWFKDDVLLAESSHYTFVYDDNECSLVVLNTRPDDSGVYTCTAKNLGGSISCKAELTVHSTKKESGVVMEDEQSILRKMRRLTDYYDVHKEIGRGAFSYVKAVTQKAGKMEYAAKFISARAKKKTSALREMSLLSDLDHERILYFHDAFETKRAVIIITEMCHEELLERMTKKSAVMESDIRSSIRQLLEGLSYLHDRNIMHLDIKPDNILMADPMNDQLRICDFGNAMKHTPDDAQYCKYGTPEFVAPEVVNQTPVSKATDIWPVGVLTYLCLTGVSPFAGENDRSSVLNIRNYNVAFEESMFADLCPEAKGFVIKLLVADKVRPDTSECLRHPWFKILNKGKSISTEFLKKFLSRRKWQRSLISYKSKMVMRSIPELLDDSSSHVSIAIPKHLRVGGSGSPPPSSSSDSDEDIEELPFIPMPLNLGFSGSRVSLTDIPAEDEASRKANGSVEASVAAAAAVVNQEPMECEPTEKDAEGSDGGDASSARGRGRKRSTQDEGKGSSDEEPGDLAQRLADHPKRPLRRGSSMDSDKPEGASRKRGELRRGGSADSALALRISPEDSAREGGVGADDGRRVLKKAVSMELPRRSASPGAGSLSQEDYALKLELMRQRLLRGGRVDGKMGGLRGPLLDNLGMGGADDRRFNRRVGPAPLVRAASTDSPREDVPKTKVLRKSASFSQGDTEPIPLHRRMGAPLEIPLAQIEERRLQEAASMSNLAADARPVTPKPPSPAPSPMMERQQEVVPSMKEKQEEVVQEKAQIMERVVSRPVVEEVTAMETASAVVVVPEVRVVEPEEEAEPTMEEPPQAVQKVMQRAATPSMLQRSVIEEKIEEVDEEEEEEEKEAAAVAAEVVVVAAEEKKEEEVKEEAKEDEPMPEATDRQEYMPMDDPDDLYPAVRPSDMSMSSSSSVAMPPSGQRTAVVTTFVTPSPSRVVLPDGRMSAYASIMQTIAVPADGSPAPEVAPAPAPTPVYSSVPVYSPVHQSMPNLVNPYKPETMRREHPAVFSRVASTEHLNKEPSPPKTPLPRLSPTKEATPAGTGAGVGAGDGTPITDIASEEVFETRFKKRESSLTRTLRRLPWRSDSEEKVVVLSPEDESEQVYRPVGGVAGGPLEVTPRRLEEKSKSVQDLREAQKDPSFMRRLSMRLRRTPSEEKIKEAKGEEDDTSSSRHRLSWASLGRRSSQDKKEVEMQRMDGGVETPADTPAMSDARKQPAESPVLAMRKKIGSTVAGISQRIRSFSEERRTRTEESAERREERRPFLSLLRRSSSGQTGSQESLESMGSMQSESKAGAETERRSRWDRWGLGRSKRDKTVSQPDIPAAITRENGSLRSRQYSRLASDFPPVFHIKLRDHVLLEGDPVTLSCLPAGSPHPHIQWRKDKQALEIDARMNMISCPDGRQLLMIMKTTKKDAGLYECVATNPLASITSSCTLSLARLPNRPGTPEVPQRYRNTALVVWRPSDTMAPCTYSLERKSEGEANWLMVATGVADCYFNVTDLPPSGAIRFRVACVNKAGQGPYSNLSEKVVLETATETPKSTSVVVKTLPSTPSVVTSSITVPLKPATTTKPVSPTPAAAAVPTPAAAPQPPTPAATPASAPPPSKPTAPVAAVSVSVPIPVHASTPSPLAQSTPAPTPTPTATATRTATPTKAKSTLNITMAKPSAPAAASQPQAAKITTTTTTATIKPAPPTILPKPMSPVNVVPPMTKAIPAVSPPPPLVSAPQPISKPISTLPMYAASAGQGMPAPTPATTPTAALTPRVVQVTTLTPGVDSGRMTPGGRTTPSGRATPSMLRQGVPQKPYTFMDEKARGRFGVIRECRENATGNLFMAKIVPYEPENKKSVLQEYDILKSLHHDKIMALHEAYVTPRYLVLISECCAGKELLHTLVDRFRYSEDDVVAYVVQVLQGLDYLHNRRILHLDIKPDNIIVTHLNVVKIIDFGSAQTFNPLFLKQFNPPLGTLDYMSPEMVKGDVVGPPADIWSVGVLTFIMLSGRLPFTEFDQAETEARIQAAKFDLGKLYQNVSQSASLFLKKILCSYPWARPSIKDCYNNAWLQDAYLMRLRRQTLTFTTTRLKEFLGQQQQARVEGATKHKVLLRSYSSTPPQTPQSPTAPTPTPSMATATVTQ